MAADDKCLELIRKYKRSSEALVENNFKGLSKCAKDNLGTSLRNIPHSIRFWIGTSSCNKDCRKWQLPFSCCLHFFRGDEYAHGLLSLLTAAELHRNARIYAYHPAFLDAANSLRRREESLIPDMLTSG